MSDPSLLPTITADGYLQFPIDVDPDTLVADQLDFIAAALPGWTPREGHLEVLLLTAFANMCSQAAAVAAQVPPGIFAYLGTLIGITAQPGTPATVASTWTMADSKGYTIPAGTVVAFRPTGDQLILFSVVNAVTVPPSSTSTAAGAVLLQAVSLGVAGNGFSGAMTLIDPLAFVSTITATAASSGGTDPEGNSAYLNRLSYQLQLLTPRPILPGDFAKLATQTVGVARALGIDGLNPARQVTDGVLNSTTTVTSATAAFVTADVGRTITGTGIPAGATISTVNSATSVTISAAATATATAVTITLGRMTGQIRTVGVIGVDAAGAALSTPVKTTLQGALASAREVNFVVTVADPTFTGIDVNYTAYAIKGATPATVKATVDAAVTAFLNPGNWAGGSNSPKVWNSGANIVRYLDVANVIHATLGVAYISSLTICVHSGTPGSSDVTLPGDGPLPTLGTLTSNVLSSP